MKWSPDYRATNLRCRRRAADLFRSPHSVIQVFELRAGAAPDPHISIGHAPSVQSQDRAVGITTSQHFDQFRRVCPALFNKRERLGNHTDRCPDYHLVRQLGELPQAMRTHQHRTPHTAQYRRNAFKDPWIATTHDRERPGLRSARAARHRCLEISDAPPPKQTCMVQRFVGANGTHVDHGRVRLQGIGHALVEQDVVHGVAAREHGNHHVGVTNGVNGRLRYGCAVAAQP